MADDIEYRNQFLAFAAKSADCVYFCRVKQLYQHPFRSWLLAFVMDDSLVHRAGVAGSTALGLGVAMFFNREFRLRKTARSLVILSYVTPSISLVFAWKYMFNNGYGIVNYLGVDLLHLYERAPLWFDNPGSSFVLVVLFAIWRYFPYAFISFLAILQTIDKSLYEAAEMDGANAWQRFCIVTLPAIMPVLATVVTLRTIWMFYMFADVYLLTTKVDILGVYLYKTAFAFNDLGKAAAISVVLFIIIFAVILLTRKRVNLNGNK